MRVDCGFAVVLYALRAPVAQPFGVRFALVSKLLFFLERDDSFLAKRLVIQASVVTFNEAMQDFLAQLTEPWYAKTGIRCQHALIIR